MAGPVRLVPWPGDRTTTQLLSVSTVSTDELTAAMAAALAAGAVRLRSGPLTDAQLAPFEACGFRVERRLIVLRATLDHPLARSGPPPRLATARWFGMLAELDVAAFGQEWGLDATAIERAVQATTVGQVRMVALPDPVAYAVVGRAGTTGYLQRLAVAPEHQGQGHGTHLVNWTLRWCRRHRCTTALVNTEDTNTVALGLYQRLGFVPDSEPLLIARWDR